MIKNGLGGYRRGRFRVGWDRLQPGRSVFNVRGLATFRVVGNKVSVHRHQSRVDENLVADFLVGRIIPMLLLRNGALPLHASVVGCGNTAMAFAGPSGAGKSSLAATLALNGGHLLADDLAALRLVGEHVTVSRGTQQVKLDEQAIQGLDLDHSLPETHREGRLSIAKADAAPTHRLGHVFFLRFHDNPDIEIEPIGGVQKPMELLSQVFGIQTLIRRCPSEAQELFERAAEIARQVEMSHLYRPRLFSALPETAATVLASATISESQEPA